MPGKEAFEHVYLFFSPAIVIAAAWTTISHGDLDWLKDLRKEDGTPLGGAEVDKPLFGVRLPSSTCR
jgi:hypothetical protein